MSTQDSGYAWIIPFACFFIQGTLFGTYRVYGLLYKVLIDNFNVSRSTAAWPFSLCMTFIHLTGPVSGMLNRYFSSRSISFVGCSLAALGVGLCYTSNGVLSIIIFIGIIQGFGIGLTYVQNTAIINEYFFKFRATAIGISLSGGTIGSLALSYLVDYSLKFYSLQECFLILSGVILITLPICCLLKPFKTKSLDGQQTADYESDEKIMKIATIYLKSYKNQNSGLTLTGPNELYFPAKIDLSENSIKMKDQDNNLHLYKSLDGRSSTLFGNLGNLVIKPNLDRKLSIYNHDNRDRSQTVNSQTAVLERSDSDNFPAKQDYDQDKEEESILILIKNILKNKMFCLICLTHMSYFWSSITYTMIIIDHAQDKGIKLSAAINLINSFAAGDLIGRLGSGWFMDNKVLPLQLVALLCSISIGALMISVTFISEYYLFIAVSATLGLFTGTINILMNVLFCKYIGSSGAALAFGLSAFFCGLVTLVRPLVVGYFRDQINGTYDGLFISLGVISILAGLLWIFESCIKNFDSDKNQESENTINEEIVISPCEKC